MTRARHLIPGLVIALCSTLLQAGVDEVSDLESTVLAPSVDTYHFQSLIAWDSRYASEGRDNLDGASISSVLLEMALDNWVFGSWLAESGEADYEERNFFITYGFEWKGIDGYLGYKLLQFPGEDNETDHEFGAGLSGPELAFALVPEINWYYSTDSGGSYLEAGLSRELILTDQWLLIPSVMVGRNDGYISDGHNGSDHARITLETQYRINARLSLQAHIGGSFAINSSPVTFPGDDLLRDFFHTGVGFTISF